MAVKTVEVERRGNRIECLDGCGRWVFIHQVICRKCRRQNQMRVAKVELRQRKAERNG